MVFGHAVPEPKLHHDEHTLFKVYDALRDDLKMAEKECRAAISAILNRGIVFRETVTPSVPSGPVYRGAEAAVNDTSGEPRSTS